MWKRGICSIFPPRAGGKEGGLQYCALAHTFTAQEDARTIWRFNLSGAKVNAVYRDRYLPREATQLCGMMVKAVAFCVCYLFRNANMCITYVYPGAQRSGCGGSKEGARLREGILAEGVHPAAAGAPEERPPLPRRGR